MMNALRLNAGFAMADFIARNGLPDAAVLPALQQLAREGLMQGECGQWRATVRGQQYLNEVIQRFLPAKN
jgi:coproporphyrinogen III oxidase-like Fe-S oxidoreductase